MAVENGLLEKLTSKLGDEVHGDQKLVDLIVEKLEYVDKLSTINKELKNEKTTVLTEKTNLAQQYESLANEKNGLVNEYENLKKELDSFKGNQTQKDDVNRELNAELNTIKDQLEALQKTNLENEKQAKLAAEQKAAADLRLQETNFFNKIRTDLENNGIVGTNTDDALAIIKNNEYAKISVGEDGYKEVIIVNKNGKDSIMTTAELGQYMAETRQGLVSSSGRVGSGLSHENNTNSITNSTVSNAKNLFEAKVAVEKKMEDSFTQG